MRKATPALLIATVVLLPLALLMRQSSSSLQELAKCPIQSQVSKLTASRPSRSAQSQGRVVDIGHPNLP